MAEATVRCAQRRQVIFVLGLPSRQNSSAFVRLAECSTYPHLEHIFMVRCGSKNHGLFVPQRDHGGDAGGAPCRDEAGNSANSKGEGCYRGKSGEVSRGDTPDVTGD